MSVSVYVCVYAYLCVFEVEDGVQKTKLYSPQSFIKEDENDKHERERGIEKFVADEKRAGLKFCEVNCSGRFEVRL